MEGFIAGSRGGKTTSKEGRDYRWQQRWEDNIQGWKGVWLAVEVGRLHPWMDGLIAGSRGGKTTSMDGRAYGCDGLMAGSRGGKTTSKDGRVYRWQ